MKQEITFGDIKFKTKKLAENYVRELLNKIGLCESVKTKNINYYDKLGIEKDIKIVFRD